MTRLLTRIAWVLTLLYALDRGLRLAAVVAFVRRPAPPVPGRWPSATLICPVTRSPNDLRAALSTRARLDYPGAVRCLLVCDAADAETQALCREMMALYPAWAAEILVIEPDGGAIASKVAKLRAALPHADGEVLCFVDDDVSLRPDALRVLAPHALQADAGAAFGVACYTAWDTLAESLMSGFVNSSALLSYLPLVFLAEPFTITGHCFALTRASFDAVGGLDGMAGRFDDDHELARRVRRRGLHNVQTSLIYDVENRLPTLADYHNQIRRWFLMPREAMLPGLGRREQAVLLLSSVGPLLPPLVALLAMAARSRGALLALAANFISFTFAYAVVERAYLRRRMPARRRLLLPFLAYLTPLHVALAALGGDTIQWRGQRLRLERGGRFTVLSDKEPPQ